MTTTHFAALLVALFGVTHASFAQSIAKDVERAGNIEYITGGVGTSEQQQVNAFAQDHNYNLKLVFTLDAGNYLADVDVVLRNQRGETLVHDVADGPMLVAKVPQGTYTVTASYNGATRSQTVRVGQDGLRTAYFRWPAGPDTGITFKPGADGRLVRAR